MDVHSPDEKSVITYVSTLYDAFPRVPDGVDGISPNVSPDVSSAVTLAAKCLIADNLFFFFFLFNL